MISYFIHDHGCKNKDQKIRECTDNRIGGNLNISCSQQNNARGDHGPMPYHRLDVDSNGVDEYLKKRAMQKLKSLLEGMDHDEKED